MMRHSGYRSFTFSVSTFLLVGLGMQACLFAQFTTIADYTFDDPNALNIFTEVGDPMVVDGQLELDGDDYLLIADPLAGATDNYVIEGVLTATAFNAFDFGFARNDPNGANAGNNGQGLLFQDFGSGAGQTKVLNSFSGATGGFGADPDPFNLPLNVAVPIAAVQNNGLTEIYVNGVKLNNPASNNNIVGTPNTLGIGTHPFDGALGAFNGKIDRVRLSTFDPNVAAFDPNDLITGVPPISLDLNTATGQAVLRTGLAFPDNVIGYDITSSATVGALVPGGWTSIADNYDADSGPDPNGLQVDPDDNWTELPASITSIAEAELNDPSGDGAQFGAALAMSLGNIWTPNPFGSDIAMTLLLEDGTQQPVLVTYDGDGIVNPVVLGDFDGSGEVDAGDWPTIRDNFRADLTGLSPAVGYSMGDINLDGAVDVLDFGEFKTLFNAVQGAGAFEQLLASVPEPSSFILFAVGGFALTGVRRRSTSLSNSVRRQFVKKNSLVLLVAVAVALMGQSATMAQLTVVADYTFDDPNSLNIFATTGNPTVTIDGQLSLDGASYLEIADPLAGAVNNYVVETIVTASSFDAFDFTFARNDPNGSGGVGGGNNGQGMLIQDFGGGPGQVKVLNSFSGATGGFGVDPDPFNVVIGESVALAAVQNGGVTEIYVNGVQLANPASNDTINDIPTNLGIGTHPFDGVNGAFNGLIDRVRLSTFDPNTFDPGELLGFVPPAMLTLEINRTTGMGEILNDSGSPLAFDFLSISSTTGSLDPNFGGLSPAGDGSGNGWETLGTPTSSLVEQAFLTAETTLLDGETAGSIGSIYTGSDPNDEAGIAFEFRLSDTGGIRDGIVTFVDGIAGDFDGNGRVDAFDFLEWQRNPSIGSLSDWEMNYGQPIQSAVESVPEPSVAMLVVVLACCMALVRIRATREHQLVLSKAVASLMVVVACAAMTVSEASAATSLDRDLRMGDDSLELGLNGTVLGSNNSPPAPGGITIDSERPLPGTSLGLTVNGDPRYVAATDRPGASGSEQAAEFDGTGDYLSTAVSMSGPSDLWKNSALTNYPLNYEGIFSQGIQLWAKPDQTALADPNTGQQDVVINTIENGIIINADSEWTMLFDRTDIASGVSVASTLDGNGWAHVMQVSGLNAPVTGDSTGGAAMYVNGIAIAASGASYSSSLEPLSIAANLDGTANFYTGILDDVEFFLWGDNTGVVVDPNVAPDPNNIPAGQNYGTFSLAEDNEWIANQLSSLGVTEEADVNLDGSVDPNDITAFIQPGVWKSGKTVNGIQIGDWETRQNGDLNYDGLVDLGDVFILHQGLLAGGFQGGFPFELLSVPEPSTACLFLLGGSFILQRRRWKTHKKY